MQRNIRNRTIVAVALALVVAGLFVQQKSANAATTPTPAPELSVPDEAPETGTNLSVSPVFLNLTTDPGEAVSSSIEVTNNNNFKEFLEVEIVKFELIDNGNGLRLEDVDAGDEFVQWVSFKEKQFGIGPNEHKKVSFTITPDKNAALGYYYAVVVKRINEVKGDAAPAVAGYPAVPLVLEVRSPNAKRELQMVEFKTDKLIYEYLPVQFELKLKNTGNIHIVPVGDIFIDRGGSKNISILKANPGRGNVLPAGERIFESPWNDGFIVRVPQMDGEKPKVDEKGNTVYKTKLDLTKADKFRIGKYTAHVLAVYDNGQRDVPLEATVSFWVIPWKILGALVVILVLAFLGLKGIVSSAVTKTRRK